LWIKNAHELAKRPGFLAAEPGGGKEYKVTLDGAFSSCGAARSPLLSSTNGHTMDITNKSKKALSIPLPGGKKLFLGPGKTGQVTAKALQHPPLVKLIEAGEIETAEGTANSPESVPGKTGVTPGSRNAGTGAMRHSGDR
jgi:hypothetical protein